MNAPATSNPSTVSAWPETDRWPAERRVRSRGSADALPAGTRRHEFELLDVLGAGGFGIVYLASDRSLQRTVAVKEYFPADFGRRANDTSVVPRDESDAAMFALGLKSFVREARLLAGFDHPSLVKVHRFWESHGTAYMVMPHYPGRTLKEARPSMPDVADERWLRRLLDRLLSALDVLHRADVYHRDVSPDNILLLPDGHPILLDFGSARQVAADRTQAITAVLKPNFAAIEQYGDVPGLRQGAWTDLYALAGVVHYLITGVPPTPAALRTVTDGMPLLAAGARPGLSTQFLGAVDWALEVHPRDRPQSIEAFRDALHGYASPPPSPRSSMPAGDGPRVGQATDLPPAQADDVAAAECSSQAAIERDALAGMARASRTALRRSAIAAVLALCVGVAWWAASRRVDVAPAAVAFKPSQPAAPTASQAPAQSAFAKVESAHPAGDGASRTAMTDAAITGGSARQPRHAALERKTSLPSRGQATPSPSTPGTAPVDGPRATCGDRNYLSMAVCMDRQCQQAAYRSHPQCAEFRRYADARRRSHDQ